MRDLAFLLLFMAPFAMSFGSIFVCVLNWAWISLLAPNNFLYGFDVGIPFNKVIAAVTVLSLVVSKERKRFRCDSIGVLVLIFLGIAALAQFGALSDLDLGWDLLDKFWKIVALYLLISCFAETPERIHALVVTACLGVGFVAIADGLKFAVTAGGFHSVGNAAWGDNNQEGLFILMGVPLLGYLRSVSTHKMARLGSTIAIGLFLIAVLSTQSRGAMIGLAVIALAGFTVTQRKWSYAAVMLALGVALIFLMPHKLVERADLISTAGDDDLFMGRVIAWKMSTLIALDHPLGGGLHAVQICSVWDQFVPEFDRLSFIPSPPPETLHAAHSIYFEVLGDTGFPGLIVFLLILFSTLIALRRTARRTRDIPELYWAGTLARQLQLTLLVYMVSGAALSAAYHDLPWLIIGLSGAVRRFVAEKVRATAQPGRAKAGNGFRSPLAGATALPRTVLR